eukprot:CAMPEP_0172694846 /NCGR_PEP_ID=MMETSP1074-20121228/26945_1 /TAXON_ID=2916 /ORGANISM="Ceratium fusus, Strain PA161109" /LENGTH=56 /DNA_ID=CAMNT_0013515387 /DNA_START=87 /DNA_END=254 /DNA_ORIENTATION=-
MTNGRESPMTCDLPFGQRPNSGSVGSQKLQQHQQQATVLPLLSLRIVLSPNLGENL